MADLPTIFDAHLHPAGLSDQDLDSMKFFGVEAALVAADHAPQPNAKAILAHFDDVVKKQLPRLAKAGLRGYAALGIHPAVVPRRGLSEILSALPAWFGAGTVVALGEIGLQAGGEAEEEAFLEQLALARRLKLPVLVHTPAKDKDRITRRVLNLLKESGVAPERVLVDHASGKTVRLILECGHWAGLTVHPEELSAERAVALIRKLGTPRVVLDSDAGDGASDILSLARLASLLERGGLSERVVARVTHENVEEFLRLG